MLIRCGFGGLAFSAFEAVLASYQSTTLDCDQLDVTGRDSALWLTVSRLVGS